jgi:hypothetical protein
MDRRLNAPIAPRAAPVRRRIAWIGLVLAVVVVHLVGTRELADRMALLDPAQAMPHRIAVAYLRVLEPEAPPPVAAPQAPAPRRLPRAPRAPRRIAAAASAASQAALAVADAASASEPPPAPESSAPTAADADERRRENEALAAAAAATAIAAASSGASEPAPSLAAAGAPASAAAAGTAPFEWPTSTRLSYALTGNYRGEVTGSAQVEWIRVDERYQVNLDLVVGPEFAPLITRRMTSEGRIAASGLVPARYDEDTQVVMRERRRVTVVFEADAVVLANGQRRERIDGVQDTASQFIQLTYLFSTRPDLLRVGASVAFPLALPRAMDAYAYEVVETQTLQSPFGPLASYHLKPRPRPTRKANELTAELWIAPELRYLPVRIRIEQDAATFIDLMISGKPEIGEAAAAVSSPAKGKTP